MVVVVVVVEEEEEEGLPGGWWRWTGPRTSFSIPRTAPAAALCSSAAIFRRSGLALCRACLACAAGLRRIHPPPAAAAAATVLWLRAGLWHGCCVSVCRKAIDAAHGDWMGGNTCVQQACLCAGKVVVCVDAGVGGAGCLLEARWCAVRHVAG